MFITVSSWSYRSLFESGTMDYDSYLTEIRRIGADGIEIFPGYLDRLDPMGHVQRIADQAEQDGLAVATLIVRNDFASADDRVRAAEIERTRTCVVTAAASGIRRLNVFTGDHAPEQDPRTERERVIDAYRQIVPFAEQNCVTLCLENCSSVCPDAEGILSVIHAFDNPALRTNPDPTNFVHSLKLSADDMFAQTRMLMPYAASFHLRTGAFTPKSANALIDMARVRELLDEFAYEGHIVLEDHGGPDPIGSCERAVAMTRKYLCT